MPSERTQGGGGVGCVVHLVAWALLIGGCLWLFAGYSPEDAARTGLAWGFGIVCGAPLLLVGLGLLLIAVGGVIVGIGEWWERRKRLARWEEM